MKSEEELQASREGLLRSESPIPLRPSLEQAYRSSSEFGEELDELDLHEELKTKKNKRARWPWSQNRAPIYLNVNNPVARPQRPSRMRRIKNCLWPRRTCLLITVILLGGLVGLIAGGGFWVYKTAPPDGVSFTCTFCLSPLNSHSSNHHLGTLRLMEVQ